MAEDKLTNEKVISEFKKAARAKKPLIDRQKKDYEFALGKQWDDKDVRELESRGVKALTVNKTRSKIKLITGLERQNRTDWRAFPEGEEDSIAAEIATRLLKNASKISDYGYKSSEAFEDGMTVGEGWLEPWLDSTFNLLNPRPQWKKLSYDCIFVDPSSVEYDLSDARYVYKITKDLTKDDLIKLYPEKEDKIRNLKNGKIDFQAFVESEEHTQLRDYPNYGGEAIEPDNEGFDLLERQYKKWMDRYFVADMLTGELEEKDSEEEAESFVREQASVGITGRFSVIKRRVPEIWIFATTGNLDEPLSDERAWFYPNWKNFGFIPIYADKATAPLEGDDRHYNVQGLVHPIRGPQEELNKRRTQELRHLNSTANSGWLTPKGAWVDRSKVEKFGSTPGINLEYDPEKGRPERIFPNPLSQGHAQMAAEHSNDMKEIPGLNEDLLALQDGGSSSGRAIALRQRQGLVMVQKYFDNLSRSKQMAGRFMLSQLGEMYDFNSAVRVLGKAWIEKTFSRETQDPATGQVTKVLDEKSLQREINRVLDPGEINKFDVAIGETVASETMKAANFSETQEIARLLTTVPPQFGEIIIENSQLPQAVKNRFLAVYEQAAMQAQQQAQIEQAEAQSAPTAAAIANQ